MAVQKQIPTRDCVKYIITETIPALTSANTVFSNNNNNNNTYDYFCNHTLKSLYNLSSSYCGHITCIHVLYNKLIYLDIKVFWQRWILGTAQKLFVGGGADLAKTRRKDTKLEGPLILAQDLEKRLHIQ